MWVFDSDVGTRMHRIAATIWQTGAVDPGLSDVIPARRAAAIIGDGWGYMSVDARRSNAAQETDEKSGMSTVSR